MSELSKGTGVFEASLLGARVELNSVIPHGVIQMTGSTWIAISSNPIVRNAPTVVERKADDAA
jgi:hypothetical protein